MSQNPDTIVICDDSDVTVKVIECDMTVLPGTDGQRPVLRAVYMKVRRQVLANASPPLNAMFNGSFGEAQDPTFEIELREDRIASLEVLFRQLHNTLTPETHNITIDDLWHIFQLSEKYDIDADGLKPWFVEWWNAKSPTEFDEEDLKKLIFPCHEIDHATAFAFVTKRLVYTTKGYIDDINPTEDQKIRVRRPIIQQLNAARGSLRNKIMAGCIDPQTHFLDHKCSCKINCYALAYYAYGKSLGDCKLWPLETILQRSTVQRCLDRLRQFNFRYPAECCPASRTFSPLLYVDKARASVQSNFQGLCMDCIYRSDRSPENYFDPVTAYEEEKYSLYCRIDHEQPSWFFSYMGQKEHKTAYEQSRKRRAEEAKKRR